MWGWYSQLPTPDCIFILHVIYPLLDFQKLFLFFLLLVSNYTFAVSSCSCNLMMHFHLAYGINKFCPFLFLLSGSLIKLVYFSRHENYATDDNRKRPFKHGSEVLSGQNNSYPILGGQLHFVKFETRNLNDFLEFVKSKVLHRDGMSFLLHLVCLS